MTENDKRIEQLRAQLSNAETVASAARKKAKAEERVADRAQQKVWDLQGDLSVELLRSWGDSPDLKALLAGNGGSTFYEAATALAESRGLSAFGMWADTKQLCLHVAFERGGAGAVDRVAAGIRYFIPGMKLVRGWARFGVLHRETATAAWQLDYSPRLKTAKLARLHYGAVQEELAFSSLEAALRHIEEHLWTDDVIDMETSAAHLQVEHA